LSGPGLERTLENHGFEIGDVGAVAVVVSFDRRLTFEKLQIATLLVRAGAPLIGTNPDRSFPTPEGLIPGAGAILAAVVAASDANPVIIGKPEPGMYLVAMERMEVSPENTLVIGDRLERYRWCTKNWVHDRSDAIWCHLRTFCQVLVAPT
jgi:4-nitrophenyl phosphatase